MPNEFEVDEKLTIAKTKPNEIEITEGNVKCSKLNVESSEINLKFEHSDLNLKPESINFVFYDKIVQRIDIAKRNIPPDNQDRYWCRIEGAKTNWAEDDENTRILLDSDILNIKSNSLNFVSEYNNLVQSISIAKKTLSPDNQDRYWCHIQGARSHWADGDSYKRILLDGITHVKGTVTADDILINSSKQLKQDIIKLSKEEAYSILEDLEPVKFSFKNDTLKKHNIGFIAEDVPDIVSDNDHKQVRYLEIISALTKVVKEQQKEINGLKQEIQKLK